MLSRLLTFPLADTRGGVVALPPLLPSAAAAAEIFIRLYVGATFTASDHLLITGGSENSQAAQTCRPPRLPGDTEAPKKSRRQ